MSKTSENAPALKKVGFPKAVLAVLAALVVVGVGCWIFQLIEGPRVTGVSNEVSWGISICLFTLFIGLSAGGLIVASSAHVFNIESFKKVALPAVITSTVCVCLAGLFILVDLGGIERFWRLFTGPNFASPLLWDIVVIFTYLAINILDIVWIVRGDERKVTILSRIALPVAILVHSVTAWIFALQLGHSWYTAIMAPIFVVSACDSGLALLLLELVLLERRGIFQTGKKLFKSLAGLLAVFIAVDAFLVGCELLTMGYPGGPEADALAVIMTGANAPFFWFEIIGGLLIPFLILVFSKNREKRGLITLASVLVVLGVLCKRVWIMFTGFIAPYAEGSCMVPDSSPIATQGLNFFGLGAIYMPSVTELLTSVGIIALGVLAFMVLSEKLILGKAKREGDIDNAAPHATTDSQAK